MTELLLPTIEETILINDQRARRAGNMALAGTAGAHLNAQPGPCSPDLNRLPDGTLGVVHHGQALKVAADETNNTMFEVRLSVEKPRTTTGQTGLIHQEGGVQAFVEAARQLHVSGVALSSEVMSETASSLVVPWLTSGWVGAREVLATGPRYAVRPTAQDMERGIHPLPVYVKNDQHGGLDDTINALRTIISDKPETRTRITHNGLETVTTLANPYVGVILRGAKQRPKGPSRDILEEEIATARERLDTEFGKDAVPITIDISHAHANYEGGGEEGQLAIAACLGDLILSGARIDGWMAETYILPGKQKPNGTIPGLSITDACIREEYAIQTVKDLDTAWAAVSQPDQVRT